MKTGFALSFIIIVLTIISQSLYSYSATASASTVTIAVTRQTCGGAFSGYPANEIDAVIERVTDIHAASSESRDPLGELSIKWLKELEPKTPPAFKADLDTWAWRWKGVILKNYKSFNPNFGTSGLLYASITFQHEGFLKIYDDVMTSMHPGSELFILYQSRNGNAPIELTRREIKSSLSALWDVLVLHEFVRRVLNSTDNNDNKYSELRKHFNENLKLIRLHYLPWRLQ
jgi:hypothetical protein